MESGELRDLPEKQVPYLKNRNGTWAKSSEEKANALSKHLSKVFTLSLVVTLGSHTHRTGAGEGQPFVRRAVSKSARSESNLKVAQKQESTGLGVNNRKGCQGASIQVN